MLDPVSIVAAVCGIVSAINSGKELFKSWRSRRKEKKEAEELEKALIHSPPRIQREHDRILSKMGPIFSRGDRTAIQALEKALKKFQRTFIQIVQSAIHQNTMLDIGNLRCVTDDLRDTTISILHELFQRLQEAASIPRGLSGRNPSTYSLPPPPYDFPPYESSEESVDFFPRDTTASLRYSLEEISRSPQIQSEGYADRLKASFRSTSLRFPQVDRLNYAALPSSALLQTHFASMSRNKYDDLYS